MRYTISPEAAEQLYNLPKQIQKKAYKQFSLLLKNYRYPSLRTSKMSGENKFEARVDRKHRFTFLIEADEIYILTIGTHDTGLGKK